MTWINEFYICGYIVFGGYRRLQSWKRNLKSVKLKLKVVEKQMSCLFFRSAVSDLKRMFMIE